MRSPTFLQRVGRSGHRLGAVPKGRLFPLSRDDLVECTALLAAIGRDELDRIQIPDAPLDVLAQQIVAEVACREWQEDELFKAFAAAWHYRELSCKQFLDVVKMLSDGFHTQRGRRSAYLHRDAVNGLLRAAQGRQADRADEWRRHSRPVRLRCNHAAGRSVRRHTE